MTPPGTVNDRPDQSSTRRNVVPLKCSCLLGPVACPRAILLCLVKRSPALQACNRTRNTQADGVPRGGQLRRSTKPVELFCCPRSPEFMPGKRTCTPRERFTGFPLHCCLRTAFHLRPPIRQVGSFGHLAMFEVSP